MGVIAMRPMLNAGYDVRLASGAITAGGTLGILIPPSVMLIVYAAVAGQSIVKLYAAAMLPGFFLTFLYLVYILGWAIINPKIAPKLPPDQYRVAVPDWLKRLERGRVTKRRSRPHRRRVSTRPGARRNDARWLTGKLRPHPQQRARAHGAAGAHGRDVRRDLVVRGHLQRPGGANAVAAPRPRPVAPAQTPRQPQPRRQRLPRRSRRSSARRNPRSKSNEPPAQRGRAARGDEHARGVDGPIDGRQGAGALLPMVLGIGGVLRAAARLSTTGAWTASSSRS